MQIYFHICLCSYLPRVPILVEDTVAQQMFQIFPVSVLYMMLLYDYSCIDVFCNLLALKLILTIYYWVD